MLSRGVPMILAGDEVLRSQGGNNNAYCQDNALSWFDWTLTETNRDMLRFTRELIALRRRHACLTANRFFSGQLVPGRSIPDIAWHGTRLDEPPWQDVEGRFLRFTMAGLEPGEEDLHAILNMSDQARDVVLPPIPSRSGGWRLIHRGRRRGTSCRASNRNRFRRRLTWFPRGAWSSWRRDPHVVPRTHDPD